MSIEKQMIKFVNIARKNPTYFVPVLEKQIESFTNDKEMPLTEEIIYETNEGKKAWIEALNFIKQQKPIDPLEEHEGLNCSARDHAFDLSRNNIFGHTGMDGSNFSERILKHCRKGPGSMAELIGADFAYENRNHAEMTILGLIIDDGVPDRGHRKTIFNPSYRQIGCKSQSQGQKIITVFNITQNKLALRSIPESNGMSASGMTFAHKPSNEMMRNSTNSPKTYLITNDDRFSKTEWVPEKSYDKAFEKSVRESKGMKENKPLEETSTSKMKFTSSSNNFGQTLPSRNGVSGGSCSVNRKLKEKKESSKVYYEEGSKITQVTTKLVYNDGTVEEKTEKHTVYLQQ